MRLLFLLLVGCALDEPEEIVVDEPEMFEEVVEPDEPEVMIDGVVGHEYIIIEGAAPLIDTTPIRRWTSNCGPVIDHPMRPIPVPEEIIVEDEITLDE